MKRTKFNELAKPEYVNTHSISRKTVVTMMLIGFVLLTLIPLAVLWR
jgi:hypothetical protein